MDKINSCIKKPELLAPAGNIKPFFAGLVFGADAIYLGAGKFSARAFAGNFSKEELILVIDYAHIFGVSVNVTVNTLFRDSEFDEVLETVKFIYEAGADAIIIQDLGLLYLLREKFPEIPLHASTQMTVHNSKHVEFLKKYGIKRVIPARELDISELKTLKEKTGIEIETFIHGALCISYSGQCQFSSFAGGRSGNRGKCAQPCRKKYDLIKFSNFSNFSDFFYFSDFSNSSDSFNSSNSFNSFDSSDSFNSVSASVKTDGKYLLSPKDLNATKSLKNLIEIGVDSFKIEGRMKRYEYVGGVVKTYREIIDSYFENSSEIVTKENDETLEKLFNRGFTDGYFIKNPGNELMSRRLPYNRGFKAGVVKDVDFKRREVSVLLNSDLSAGDGISIGNVKSGTKNSKDTKNLNDPRAGFTVRKMFSNNRITDYVKAGETVSIPAASLFSSERSPKAGDILYITSDEKLHREIEEKMPLQSDEEIKELVENCANSAEFAQAVGAFPFKIPVSFKLKAKKGEKLTLTLKNEKDERNKIKQTHEIIEISDFTVEKSQKNPFKKEQAYNVLTGLGTTFFEPKNVEIELENDVFIPLGVLKGLRNDALTSLLNAFINSFKRNISNSSFNEVETEIKSNKEIETEIELNKEIETEIESNKEIEIEIESNKETDTKIKKDIKSEDEFKLSISVYSKDALFSAINAGADRIYVGGNTFKSSPGGFVYGLNFDEICNLLETEKIVNSEKSRIFYTFSQITKDADFDLIKSQILKLVEYEIGGFVATNPGMLELLCETVFDSSGNSGSFDSSDNSGSSGNSASSGNSGKFEIISDFSFNIFNSNAAFLIFESGANCVSLSPEMSLEDINEYTNSCIENYGKRIQSECLIHGLIQIMITEHPLIQTLTINEIDAIDIIDNNDSNNNNKNSNNNNIFYALKDSKGFMFPVLVDEFGRNHVFNSKILNTIDFAEDIYDAGIRNFKIEGFGFSPEDIENLLYIYRNAIAGNLEDLYEKYDMEKYYKNSTKGMYMRTVL